MPQASRVRGPRRPAGPKGGPGPRGWHAQGQRCAELGPRHHVHTTVDPEEDHGLGDGRVSGGFHGNCEAWIWASARGEEAARGRPALLAGSAVTPTLTWALHPRHAFREPVGDRHGRPGRGNSPRLQPTVAGPFPGPQGTGIGGFQTPPTRGRGPRTGRPPQGRSHRPCRRQASPGSAGLAVGRWGSSAGRALRGAPSCTWLAWARATQHFPCAAGAAGRYADEPRPL